VRIQGKVNPVLYRVSRLFPDEQGRGCREALEREEAGIISPPIGR
jgi:hypothetical protein